MDTTELHYLTYDADEIYRAMQTAYVDAGGDILYPGDEKEMLLRAVQSILIQAFAGVDNALRMDTLRYAVGEYLDIYGEKRGCARIEAAAATSAVRIVCQAGESRTIAAGAALTADSDLMWVTTEDIVLTGVAQTLEAGIACRSTGTAGNGLLSGTVMQFMSAQPGVVSVTCSRDASGGQDRESDDSYRARLQAFGLANITTGPATQYEAAARAVSSVIVDAKAVNLGAGGVGVYLILSDQTGAQALLEAVEEALNAEDVRPLTDQLTVAQADEIAYTLNVRYQAPTGSNLTAALAAAVAEYQNWQDNVIGQTFNPDKLMAALYSAGATRVLWGPGSEFDGGAVEYTEIPSTSRCLGTITLEAMA